MHLTVNTPLPPHTTTTSSIWSSQPYRSGRSASLCLRLRCLPARIVPLITLAPASQSILPLSNAFATTGITAAFILLLIVMVRPPSRPRAVPGHAVYGFFHTSNRLEGTRQETLPNERAVNLFCIHETASCGGIMTETRAIYSAWLLPTALRNACRTLTLFVERVSCACAWRSRQTTGPLIC